MVTQCNSPSPTSSTPSTSPTSQFHRRALSTSTRVFFPSMTNPSMRSPPTTPPRRGRGNGSVSFRYVNESPTNAALLRKTRRRKSTSRVFEKVGQWFERHGSTRPSVLLTLLTCLIVAFGLFSLAETPRTDITDELSGWVRIASKVHPNNWAPGYSDTFRYKSQNHANGPTKGEVVLAEAAPYEDVSNPDDEPEALDPVPIHGAGRRPIGGPQRVDIPAKPTTEDKGVPQNVHPIDEDEVPSNGIEEASEKDGTKDNATSNQTNRHDGGDRDGDHYEHDHDPDREEQNPDIEDDTDLSEGKNAEDDDQEDVVDEDDPDHLEQELQAVVAAAALAASAGSKPVEVVTLKPKFEDDRKFLFAAWIGEQETKAQLHLYQLGLLAVALNRTLVLPQVHKSRFSTCYTSPFSLYYSIDTLDSFNIPWITHADFLALAHRESQNQKSESSAKTGQLVGMVRGKEFPADAAIIPLNDLCLANLGLELEAYEPKAFFRNSGAAKIDREGIEFAQRMIEDLQARDPNTGTTADVIVIQYNLRHQILTPGIVRPYQAPGSKPVRKYQYFQYSSHWTLLGQQMAQALSPFLAVHWRTETVSVDVLRPCGLSLIAWVKQAVAKRPEVKTVYFAMDYPIELWFDGAGPGSKFSAHSGSMTKTITAEHHAAFRGFVEDWKREFGDTVKMTSFKGVLGSVELDKDLRALLGVGANQAQADFDRLDEAIVGIVDKNILAKAEVFLAGSPSTGKSTLAKYCAKNSQFTEQVIDGRTTAIKKQGSSSMASSEGQLWNAVDRFARTPSRQRT
ncbi:BZ3500_MvSof-1268-A1-R1_Chr1-3g01730 [Microbotryum saponariae]|uniref:BZ3500_MvSof-1268-A1-R1_Chr1-3g01730 protein n=1 Tax=Microbotryum saponariae TaxID=289078 RepID=A0A2X0MFA9_9BASI|nr:BZ3500_MvSof-1268-A1-R1_Chr1-3g01730 [Microbotryum saponariae]SCZ94455.1 BZ3501_MvSof-1269-A2-R1_Chr1-3g01331 [Microbotryum saponariae]